MRAYIVLDPVASASRVKQAGPQPPWTDDGRQTRGAVVPRRIILPWRKPTGTGAYVQQTDRQTDKFAATRKKEAQSHCKRAVVTL